MSEPERRSQEDLERELESKKFNPYPYLLFGLWFVIATFYVMSTSEDAMTGFTFVIAAVASLGKGVSELRGRHRAISPPADKRAVSPPVDKEKELLSAIRDSDGSITPAEAAMETSLNVREADEILSELTSNGYLQLESHSGALYYSLPARKNQKLSG